jgi:hypothetical protein
MLGEAAQHAPASRLHLLAEFVGVRSAGIGEFLGALPAFGQAFAADAGKRGLMALQAAGNGTAARANVLAEFLHIRAAHSALVLVGMHRRYKEQQTRNGNVQGWHLHRRSFPR